MTCSIVRCPNFSRFLYEARVPVFYLRGIAVLDLSFKRIIRIMGYLVSIHSNTNLFGVTLTFYFQLEQLIRLVGMTFAYKRVCSYVFAVRTVFLCVNVSQVANCPRSVESTEKRVLEKTSCIKCITKNVRRM